MCNGNVLFVIDLPLSEINDFPNHPFKVKIDDEMLEMAESIKRYGVLVPGLVRSKEGGGYEMVSGHRCRRTTKMDKFPYMVRLKMDKK